MRTDRLLIVDVEATCWPNKIERGDQPQEIIEIGYAVVSSRERRIVEEGGWYVAPTRSLISPFCTSINGVTPELVERADTFEQACARLRARGSRAHPWASWGDFDRKLFEEQCRNEQVEYPFARRHLNLKLATALLLGWGADLGMAEALSALRMPLEGRHHSGIDDARNIARIWCEILDRLGSGVDAELTRLRRERG